MKKGCGLVVDFTGCCQCFEFSSVLWYCCLVTGACSSSPLKVPSEGYLSVDLAWSVITVEKKAKLNRKLYSRAVVILEAPDKPRFMWNWTRVHQKMMLKPAYVRMGCAYGVCVCLQWYDLRTTWPVYKSAARSWLVMWKLCHGRKASVSVGKLDSTVAASPWYCSESVYPVTDTSLCLLIRYSCVS